MPEFKTVSLSKKPAPVRYWKRDKPAGLARMPAPGLYEIAARLRKSPIWLENRLPTTGELMIFLQELAGGSEILFRNNPMHSDKCWFQVREIGDLRPHPGGGWSKPLLIQVEDTSLENALLGVMRKLIVEAV